MHSSFNIRATALSIPAILLGMVLVAVSAPIHQAVENDDRNAVAATLKADPAAVNAQTSGGSTPLHLAVGIKNAELVKYLIDKGADLNKVTAEGYTPLHWAAFFNAGEVATILIESGAKTDLKTKTGVTPLQLALSENAQDVAEALVNKTKAVYVEPALDARYKQGENALKSGDHATAYKILTELLKKDPANQKVNFAYGMTCMAMRDYPRARLAFERILMANPGNDRARLELARAQVAGKQYEVARQNLSAVLAHELSPIVRRNVERYLREVEKYSKKHSLSGRIDVGYIDDSNVNVGPDSDIIDISPIIFGSLSVASLALGEDSLPTEAEGRYVSAAVSASFDAGEQGGWLAFTDLMVYDNDLGDAEAFESRYFMLAAGGSRGDESGLVRLPLRFSHIDSGGESLVDMFGFAPVYRMLKSGGRVTFTTRGVFEMRDYTELDDRDGFFISAGESVKMIAKGGKASITMGLTVSHDGTDAGIYEYNSFAWTLALDQVLPLGFITYGRISKTSSSYDEKEALALEKREDSQRQYVIGLTRRIGSRCGFDVNYQNARNTSTFGLYQYDRKVTTASVYCTF